MEVIGQFHDSAPLFKDGRHAKVDTQWGVAASCWNRTDGRKDSYYSQARQSEV
jgi:hypothetical protein